MKLLLKLSLNNIKKYAREVTLVVISITLTISMMSMVALTMGSMYKTYISQINDGYNSNGIVNNVKNVPKLLDALGRDKVEYYTIAGGEHPVYILDDYDIYIYPKTYANFKGKGHPEQLLSTEIIEGRKSENELEIIVSKESKYQVGDILEVTSGYEETFAEHQVTVVGRNASKEYYNYYLPEALWVDETGDGYTLDLLFVEGTKHVDKLIKDAMADPSIAIHSQGYSLDDDYNFANGYQSKPGPMLYAFMVATIVMLLIVGAVTFTLIMNSFNALMNTKIETFSILRSVGATKSQISTMIIIEVFILSTVGIILGLGLGYGIAKQLLSFVESQLNSLLLSVYKDEALLISFWGPLWNYIIVMLVGYLTIFSVLRSKLKALFKLEAVETVKSIDIKKISNQEVIQNKPMKQMAKINTKTLKDYQGIKIALTVIVVLLITINGWVGSVLNIGEASVNKFDTEVSIYGKDNISVFDDLENIKKEVLSYDNINRIDIYSNITAESADKEPGEWGYIEINILDEETFNHFTKANKVPENSNVILVREENLSDDVSSIKIVNNTLNLKDPQDEDREVSIAVDYVLEEHEQSYSYLLGGQDTVVMSQAYYELNMGTLGSFNRGHIKIDSDLSLKELDELVLLFDGDTYDGVYLSSEYYDSYIKKVVRRTVTIVTTFIFIYIGFVVLVNVVNISISNSEKRKKDLAILKSMGATSKQIDQMLLWEILYVLFKPWLYGLVIGNVLNAILYFILKFTVSTVPIKYQWDLLSMALSLILVVVITLVQIMALKIESKKSDIITDIRSY